LIIAHRAMAWLADQPSNQTLAAELLLVAGICGMGGLMPPVPRGARPPVPQRAAIHEFCDEVRRPPTSPIT
jgi:hypothetical protein